MGGVYGAAVELRLSSLLEKVRVAQPLIDGSKVDASSPHCLEGHQIDLNSRRSFNSVEGSGGNVGKEQVDCVKGKKRVIVEDVCETPERFRHL